LTAARVASSTWVDQPRRKLDELALLVVAVGGRLDIEVRQHAQQRRANINAFATGEAHQPVESGKQRLGHGEIRDLEEILVREPNAGSFKGSLRKTRREVDPIISGVVVRNGTREAAREVTVRQARLHPVNHELILMNARCTSALGRAAIEES
jgi:hypothetical protein